MKKGILVLFCTILLAASTAYGQEGTDTQVWNLNSIQIPLDRDNEKLSGVILTDLRLTGNVSDLSDKRVGFGVQYKATDNITVQGSYIFRQQDIPGDAPDNYEHHLLIDVTPAKKFKNFAIANRNRFEHRIRLNERDDKTFYRNLTRLDVPIKKDGKEIIAPFVFNEPWIEIQDGQFFRNDLAAGVRKRFNKNVATDFYYLYRRDFQSGTKHINAIGVNFVINVD